MTIFPTTAVSDFTTSFTGVSPANIAVVLGILALIFGVQ